MILELEKNLEIKNSLLIQPVNIYLFLLEKKSADLTIYLVIACPYKCELNDTTVIQITLV